ncbi:MAG: hypothetical protein RLZZ337_1454 [Bacteroidota bacterium]|jgi:pyrroloquinoline quinone biosynthesis protein B
MKYVFLSLTVLSLFLGCKQQKQSSSDESAVSLVILGTVQDAGSPHIGCAKLCCKFLFESGNSDRKVVSLGLIDHSTQKSYLFEATPDIATQLKNLKQWTKSDKELPDGIFVTHAHIGHYTGLMYLGKEATNASNIPVYCMSRMHKFLNSSGPWNQLIALQNIELIRMQAAETIVLSDHLQVTPILVPHRDEYSETVGYRIDTKTKKVLFIPDIDKWSKWPEIIHQIKVCDYVFVDGTFYDGQEINNRDISEIPHPFVVESLELFKDLSSIDKGKIHFIHLNHTNPLLNINSTESRKVEDLGFRIARKNDLFKL